MTSLAEDEQGRIFVIHRQTGVEAFDAKTGKRLQSGAGGAKTNSYANCLLLSGRSAWVGQYGGGLLTPADMTAEADTSPASSSPVAALPVPAPPPTLAELNKMLKVVSAVAPNKNELEPKVVVLQDDWLTQGNWLGRYGRYWACLCAICSPDDYLWGAGWETVSYESQIGPHAAATDSLRYFVTELYTQNPRVLEMPPTYLDSRVKKGLTTPDKNRREAEIDDHGEDYPQAVDGPDIYTTLTVPNGLFTLSLYAYNKDAHGEGGNRFRDYRVSIRPQPNTSLDDISTFETQPELAHKRIRDFCGGVYERFLVRGPMTLTVKLDRNYSRNAILQSVMLDLVDETPPPYFGTVKYWEAAQEEKEKQLRQAIPFGKIAVFHPATTQKEAADNLLILLDKVQTLNSAWWGKNGRRFYAPLLRWYAKAATQPGQNNIDKHLASCYYQMGFYQTWEEEQKHLGLTPARDIEKALRWNGISNNTTGYKAVTEYLAQQNALKSTQR